MEQRAAEAVAVPQKFLLLSIREIREIRGEAVAVLLVEVGCIPVNRRRLSAKIRDSAVGIPAGSRISADLELRYARVQEMTSTFLDT
ncbi:MAG: hypothetical protein ACREN6_13775 [Gemmatimonadaceae bacterium]